MRRMVAGLRGRLLLALVATSMVTLGAAADGRARPAADAAARPERRQPRGAPCSPPARASSGRCSARREDARRRAAADAAFELREQTDARVLVGEDVIVTGGVEPASLPLRHPERRARPGDGPADPAHPAPARDGGRRRRRRPAGRRPAVRPPRRGAGHRAPADRGDQRGRARSATRSWPPSLVGLGVAIALAVALSGTLLRRLGPPAAGRAAHHRRGAQTPPPRATAAATRSATSPARWRCMQEELRRQEAARRAFVATASHELRTPLTMLQGTSSCSRRTCATGASTSPTPSCRCRARGASCAACRRWQASCSTSAGSTPRSSCAPSRSSSASSRGRSRPSSSCARASAADARGRPARPDRAGAPATPTRSPASCASCSTTRCATARRASRSA